RIPLPLQTQLLIRKRVTGSRHFDWETLYRFTMARNRFAYASGVDVLPDLWPVIIPAHGLQMQDASVNAFVLKMKKPVIPLRCLHPGALVRTIHWRVALLQHDAVFIRTVNIFCAEDTLPARRYTTRRRKDVVVTITLVKFWPFQCAIFRQLIAVDYDGCFIIQNVARVRRHTTQRQLVADSGTTRSPGMQQICIAVVVPERCGINQSLAG